MTMLNDERRKVLTKYLGLCWHEGRMPINCGYRCIKCGDTFTTNRTFDNRNDLMDLYEALYREMKWFGFRLSLLTCDDSHAFCLSGEGYEQRCKMVAEFYGWEEGK